MREDKRIDQTKVPNISRNSIANRMVTALSILVIMGLLPASIAGAQSQTPTKEMSDAIEVLCPELFEYSLRGELNERQSDLLARCSELKIGLLGGENQTDFEQLRDDQKDGLGKMTSSQTSSMSTISVEVTRVQAGTILGRIASLRGGGGGAFSMAFNGKNADPYRFPTRYAALESDYYAATEMTGHAMAEQSRFGTFFNAFGGWGDKDETAFEPGFDYDSWGAVLGADYRLLPNLIVGAALGYAATDADLDGNLGDVESDGYAFSLYGLYQWNDFYVDAIGSYGRQDYDMTRNVQYVISPNLDGGETIVNQRFEGDPDADEYSFSAGVGYDFYKSGWQFGPYARFNYYKSEIDSYEERLVSGNAAPGFGLALAVEEQDIESFTTVLGGQVSRAWNLDFGVFTPYLRFDWEHEYQNDERTLIARFADVPNTEVINSFNRIIIPMEEPDRDFFNLGIGVSAIFPHQIMAFINYQTVIGLDDVTANQIAGGIRFEF